VDNLTKHLSGDGVSIPNSIRSKSQAVSNVVTKEGKKKKEQASKETSRYSTGSLALPIGMPIAGSWSP
jgi:hypothetical protein